MSRASTLSGFTTAIGQPTNLNVGVLTCQALSSSDVTFSDDLSLKNLIASDGVTTPGIVVSGISTFGTTGSDSVFINGGTDTHATATLRFRNNAGNVNYGFIQNRSDNITFGTNSTDPIFFETNNTRRVTITSDGHLGIGTTSPTADLVVKQSGSEFTTQSQTVALFQRSSTTGHGSKIAIVAGNAASSDINFGDVDDEDAGLIQYVHADNSFKFCTNGAISNERLLIDSSGFITQTFASNNSTTAEGFFINNTTNATGNNVSLIFSNDSGNRKKAAIALIDTGSYGSGDLVFSLDGNDSGELNLTNDERLRITSAGDVGIGTVTPGAALHVLSSSYPTATIQRDHPVNYPRLRLINTSNNGGDIDGIGDGSPAGGLRFTTIDGGTSTIRMTLTSAGNVSIADGNLVVASGHGIDFSAATSGGSVTSSLLDDYEEGTYTPVLSFGGGSTGIVYIYAAGYYNKVGRMAMVNYRIECSNVGSSTGEMRVSLPFTVDDSIAVSSVDGSGYFGYTSGFSSTQIGAEDLSGYAVGGQSYIKFSVRRSSGDAATLNQTDVDNDLSMSFTVFYNHA